MHKTKTIPLQLVAMVFAQLFVVLLQFKATESARNIALPGCPDRCGDVPIPYPFGIGTNCSMSRHFDVTCKNNSRNHLTSNKINAYLAPYLYLSIEIAHISVPLGQAGFKLPIARQCYNTTTKEEVMPRTYAMNWMFFPFWLNNEKNKLIVAGCNSFSYISFDNYTNYSVGCLSTCDTKQRLTTYGPSCSGIGCCKTDIPIQAKDFLVHFDMKYNHSLVYNISRCSYAMVAEEAAFSFNTTSITTDALIDETVPTVFDWYLGNDTTCEVAQTNQSSYACKSSNSTCLNSSMGTGYICNCTEGYEGNPYLEGGCQDIDECVTQNPCSKHGKCHNRPGTYRCSCSFGWKQPGSCAGVVALSLLVFATYVIRERRNLSKIKTKYFQQHGGWVPLENIKSHQGFGFIIFTTQQVEQATNNFDSSNIIGHGGNGTVYKGILRDQTVAIKKCKIVDESKKKEFGKEMLILSQISHKNIVKLLGCCLEVEVPMLVYEFIPNGTLFHYIHYKTPGLHIPLTLRLRIAHELAEALAYLHTAASPPIFYGDVKSTNILLDQNYVAKVSDFGASILVPTYEVQFVTVVQGTCGYLDSEYMQSCQLTDKSDVYSFGVVLLELLTSKPVIDFDAPEEARSLSTRFLAAMKKNKMHELIDDEIKHDDDMEVNKEVAELALECLRMKGEERPTMKKVAEELHQIGKMKRHSWREEYNSEEATTLLGEGTHHEMEIEHTSYYSMQLKEDESTALWSDN